MFMRSCLAEFSAIPAGDRIRSVGARAQRGRVAAETRRPTARGCARHLSVFAMLAMLAAAQDPAPPEPAPRRTSFQAAVNGSVERAVSWLRAQQQKDGNWNDGQSKVYPMGVTALATLALLRSDVPPEDQAIV